MNHGCKNQKLFRKTRRSKVAKSPAKVPGTRGLDVRGLRRLEARGWLVTIPQADLDRLRGDEALLRRELEAAGVKFRGKECRCIFHDDKKPSAGVHEKDGVWRYKCHACGAGGDIFDIRALLNKTRVEDEIRKEAARQAPPAPMREERSWASLEELIAQTRDIEAVYKYTNPATGKPDMVVIRIKMRDRKKFLQCRPRVDGRWVWGVVEPRPLYNRGRVAREDRVVVVEGEKCVHALHNIGIVATTSPQGASSPQLADWAPLAGKQVILWADNDDNGRQYVQTVQKQLMALGDPPSMRMVQHEALELGDGGDVADFIERYKGWKTENIRAAVEDVLEDARAVGVYGDFVKEMEAVIAGQRRTIPFYWKRLNRAARALMPGTVTCIFGPPGSTKSLFLMDAIVDWVASGIKVCIYELEDNREYHLRRALAQLCNDSRVTDNDWVEENGDIMRELMTSKRGELESIGRIIWEAPNEEVSFEMLESWVEQRAKDGFDIIIIDPVTAIQSPKDVWVADQRFVFKVKTVARRHGTRVVLVTHPRKGQKPVMVGLDDMAGGAAYQRFSHTVLLIERNDKLEEYMVRKNQHFAEACAPNRIVKIPKARNGPGAGCRIAFEFHGESLRFEELGMIETGGAK